MSKRLFFFIMTACALSAADGFADESPLHKLSIQQLMEMEITSVSGGAQPLLQTAAAVTVLTQEDIRRSGVTSIPQLFRRVPGMQVSQTSSSQWAVSARGFNSTISNKLQVLIDGRSVYTPLFAGVYWDVQDLMLEDIERIEIIRGPGATVWGANAVNGVVNITTKKAADTQGSLLTMGAGNEERAFGGYRFGGQHGDTDHYRVYGKYFDRDDAQNGNDSWRQGRGGFRIDRQADTENSYTFQGDYYSGENDVRYTANSVSRAPFVFTLNEDEYVAGGDLLWRWSHVEDDTRDSQLQIYYDNTLRDRANFEEERHTFDVDWKKRFPVSDRHLLTWGLGWRLMWDDTAGATSTSFSPADEIDQLFSAFLQDEIRLSDPLLLTVGSKFEHNDYTGYEVQPSARLSWQLAGNQTLWASVARAIRMPTRLDHHLRIRGWLVPGTTLGEAIGDSDVESEELIAYEAGWRFQPTADLSLDAAVFANHYDHLTMWRPGQSYNDMGFAVVPYYADDQMSGQAHGIELASEYQATPNWRLGGGYSFLVLSMSGGDDALAQEPAVEGNSPRNQLFVRSYLDLPGGWELNGTVRYVDELDRLSTDSYVELDLNLVWHVSSDTTLTLAGQNLVEEHHAEFASSASQTASRVERSVYAKLTRRF